MQVIKCNNKHQRKQDGKQVNKNTPTTLEE